MTEAKRRETRGFKTINGRGRGICWETPPEPPVREAQHGQRDSASGACQGTAMVRRASRPSSGGRKRRGAGVLRGRRSEGFTRTGTAASEERFR